MREQEKRKLIAKIKTVSNEESGQSLYLRPFQNDLKVINEISRASGEKKSAVAQKLLHLALCGKQFEFTDERREIKQLEWLVSNEKHKIARIDMDDARFERLEEHARELENIIKETCDNSRFTKLIVSEIYCIANICMSYLNQIFTKIIEYFSPVEIERKHSTDFANRNILGLIEHSLLELEKLCEHHELEQESTEPDFLYLFTKIETIKARLITEPTGELLHQEKP